MVKWVFPLQSYSEAQTVTTEAVGGHFSLPSGGTTVLLQIQREKYLRDRADK